MDVCAWLRMVARTGDYPAPTSEDSYTTNSDEITIVVPSNGGILQADGTWYQIPAATENDFAVAIPNWARSAGQEYYPSLDPGHSGTAALYTVLDSAALQQVSVNDLLSVLASRYDSPTGVVYDIVPLALAGYPALQGEFMAALAEAVKGAGYSFHVACMGFDADSASRFPSVETIASVADSLYWYCYGYRDSAGQGSPRYWEVSCIEYLLERSGDLEVLLGVPLFSTYWPDNTVSTTFNTPVHSQALTIVSGAGEFLAWDEGTAPNDIVREKKADIPNGTTGVACVHDEDTIKHRLGLASEYNLAGVMLFTPGMEDSGIWSAVGEWDDPWHGYIAVENLNLTAGQYSDLLTIVKAQGRLSNSQPSNITHSRTLSATEEIVEVVFRYGEMAQGQCIQWVASVLGVDSDGVSCSEAANVWTVAHGGTDYASFNLFGGFGSSWINSGTACREYIG